RNRGGGFQAREERWPSVSDIIRDLNDHDSDNPGGKVFRDIFDIDGDGLVDLVDFSDPNGLRVYRNLGGAWCASEDGQTCSPSGGSVAAVNFAGTRPDLLVQLENGIGGTTYLDYRPSTQWDNTDASGIPRLPFVNWTLTGIGQDE